MAQENGKRLGALLALLGLAAPSGAQGAVWVVDDDGGPGVDFTNLQAAVLAAADGDTVLVKDGTYLRLRIDNKSLTVTAEEGATVRIQELPGQGSFVGVHDLSETGEVLIRGIEVVPNVGNFLVNPSFSVSDCRGQVWLEDCTGIGNLGVIGIVVPPLATGAEGLRVTDSRSVVLTRCSFTGSGVSLPGLEVGFVGDGLSIDSAEVYAYDSEFEGGTTSGVPDCGVGTAVAANGATLETGFLYAAGCTFRGGAGGAVAGVDGAGGGNGLELVLRSFPPTASVLDCTFVAGAGSPGDAGCLDGADGQPTLVQQGAITTFAGRSYSFEAESPVREGRTTSLTFEADPGDLLLLGLALKQSSLWFPPLSGTIHFDLLIQPLLVGPTPPAGQLVLPLAINPLPAGLITTEVYLQAIVLTTGLQVFLSAPSALVILDSTL